MTSKERSRLRAMASTMKPIMQIGKEGIGENLIASLSEALEARELVKVHILPSAAEDLDNLAENVADLTGSVAVAVIGRMAIFYRRSSRKDIRHIEL